MPAFAPLPCSIHALCGACNRMDLDTAAQLKAKVNRVEKLLGQPIERVHASPLALGYRARIELKTDPEGRLGYFRPRSHDHVVVPECVIARPELGAVLERLPPLPGLPVIELRSDGERVVLHAKSSPRQSASANPKAYRKLLKRLLGTADQLSDYGLAGVAVAGRSFLGDCQLRVRAGEIEHHISPASFYQVNLEVNRALVARVQALVGERSASTILDLYSGAGNLSMPLAKAGRTVIQVELAGSSVRDARATAEREGLTVDIREANAGHIQAGEHFFDLAILDPPRAGAPGVLQELMVTRPRTILYLSCDPKSLARDLLRSQGCGYRVAALELFDMFPQTSHVETLCILERSS